MEINRINSIGFGSPIVTKKVLEQIHLEDDENNTRLQKIKDTHPNAKMYITGPKSRSPIATIKDSWRAGHLTGVVRPKYTISIHDFVKKDGDTYTSDTSNLSRNAAVNENINISNVNGEGSTLVVSDYDVYGDVSLSDLEKATKKYDQRLRRVLKKLK